MLNDRSQAWSGAAAAAGSVPVRLPVAVLGAGPVGLAAIAKLVERGTPCVLLEAADTVGANLLDFGHVRLFSPWRYNVDPTMAEMLGRHGWTPPPQDELPLAREIVDLVLKPFAALADIAPLIRLQTKVVALSREGHDKVRSEGRADAPFVIRALERGAAVELRASAVIDATGTWQRPNPLGASGLRAAGEEAAAAQIFYGIPDVLGAHRRRYEGKRTLVVGAGHSAANALLALAELAREVPTTRLAWSVRSPVTTRVFGGGAADALPARGQLGAALRRLRDGGKLQFVGGLRIVAVHREAEKLTVTGLDLDRRTVRLDDIDEIVCATGQRPDLSLTSELRVRLDASLESTEALGPLIDPNVHSCGTVRPHGHRELAHPEPGLYTVGVKSYGRAPTFLMTTGFEQVRSVVAAIAGDLEAADRVELQLPETGVCGVTPSSRDSAASCCWIPEAKREVAVASAASSCGTRSCGPRHKDGQTVAAAASDLDCALEARQRGCCGSAQSLA